MKVSELIEILKEYNQDAEVILSKDPEGNGYSSLYSIDEGSVHPDNLETDRIDSYYSDAHSDDDCCLDPGERDGFAKVICLWP
jgi:hypothetical protein